MVKTAYLVSSIFCLVTSKAGKENFETENRTFTIRKRSL